MEVWKSVLADEGYFERKIKELKKEYKKIEDVKVYEYGFSGGMVYDIYDYVMKNGQRVLLCVTTLAYVDDVNDQGLLIRLDNDEQYELEDIKQIIKDYNNYYDKTQNILDVVYTFAEAAEKWKLFDGSVLRNAVRQGRFNTDEYKQSGKVWLVTHKGMERVYGKLEDK